MRYQTFMKWCDQHPTQEALAAVLGVSQGYIGQIKNKRRPITEKTARKFEKAMGLEPGAMDRQPQTAKHKPLPIGTVRDLEVVTTGEDFGKLGNGSLPTLEVHAPRLKLSDAFVAFYADDNAMKPEFGIEQGDTIIADTKTLPKQDDIVLAIHNQKIIARQLIGDSLVASNKYFNEVRDGFSIVGIIRQRTSNKTF